MAILFSLCLIAGAWFPPPDNSGGENTDTKLWESICRRARVEAIDNLNAQLKDARIKLEAARKVAAEARRHNNARSPIGSVTNEPREHKPDTVDPSLSDNIRELTRVLAATKAGMVDTAPRIDLENISKLPIRTLGRLSRDPQHPALIVEFVDGTSVMVKVMMREVIYTKRTVDRGDRMVRINEPGFTGELVMEAVITVTGYRGAKLSPGEDFPDGIPCVVEKRIDNVTTFRALDLTVPASQPQKRLTPPSPQSPPQIQAP